MLTANEIRQQFIDFFCQKHGHTFVPSSPVVPHDDPTLLFTNAGMNQFKDVFLGTGTRPYKRAANTQKCIRAGGKHNDLDDVGKDTYHHTFFEMLGNWSFGDYFKKEAIQWAWELLTDVWKLDKSRLHATVFEGSPDEGVPRDDEAYELWKTVTDIDQSHIHFGGKKDNFWEMGDTGPCGPCSEIHIDRTPDNTGGPLVNKGTADVIEIWNLVFIQFNRNADRTLTPLPAKHVDTGMGFERVTAVLQKKESNYDTDVFAPIFTAIQQVTGAPVYTGKLDDLKDTAYRVIADHIRTLTFALTDGAQIGNEGRDYVLKRILRRAGRYGWQHLGATKPFLCDIVQSVVETMGDAFPELRKAPARLATTIEIEESAFLGSINEGIEEFWDAVLPVIEQAVARQRGLVGRKVVLDLHGNYLCRWGGGTFHFITRRGEAGTESGEPEVAVELPDTTEGLKSFIRELGEPVVIPAWDAFVLHDTFGLYIDITEQMASEIGVSVDRAGYEVFMQEARERSRAGRKKPVETALLDQLPLTDDSVKYEKLTAKAQIVGWTKDYYHSKVGKIPGGDQVALLLDKTNFYAEQGGQVGDRGWIKTRTGTFEVEDTQRLGDAILHLGKLSAGTIEIGQQATLKVSDERANIRRNHTATHLLNWTLRKVLGDHVEQKGSRVDASKTRFDFSHDEPLTPEQIGEVERLVNEKIYADLPVRPIAMPLEEAKKLPGVRAVFGEKYPDPSRILMIGGVTPQRATSNQSVEFCGGTHVSHTGQIGFFKIVSQELVAKGVRRVTAVTGPEAVKAVQRLSGVVEDLTGRFRCKPEDLPVRIDSLQEEIKKLQQQIKKGSAVDLAAAADKLLADAKPVNGALVVIGEMPAGSEEQLRNQIDRIKQKAGSAVVLVGWTDDGKVGLIAAATDDLVKKGVHAGKLVGEVAKVVGGGGGGRPTMAQAGGKEPGKLGEALALGKRLAAEALAK